MPSSEATARGYSGVHLLVIDEEARIEDTRYGSLRPMLAVSAGRLGPLCARAEAPSCLSADQGGRS
jgi:hypothetical protein